MSDMDSREAEIDHLLRQSMAAPVPRLSPDFPEVLARELRRTSQRDNHFRRTLLAGYGAVSGVTSIVVMRAQGLGWLPIAVMTLAPLATLELSRRLRRWQWE